MRTRIDLPDSLYRQATEIAAREGITLGDLLVRFVEEGLTEDNSKESFGRSYSIPVQINLDGGKMPILTNAEIFEMLDLEDDWAHGRSR